MARGKKTEQIPEEPPSVQENLYKILGVEENATPEAIKSAYKKNALKHHPDKVSDDARDEAHKKFQQIALAYAVLSDPRRRKNYDRTGNTEEVLGEDGDFDWMDFYREQLSAMLDTRAISDFQKKYQGSDEEKGDLLEAYETHKGDMDRIYDSVMLSNVLEDDERFRAILDKAIADEEVETYKKYTEEPEKKRQQRKKRAQKEAKEAEKLGKEVEENKNKKAAAASKASKGSAGGEDDLLAMITKRQQQRGQGFLAQLEEKYGQPNGKRVAADEPSEEAFAAVGARKKSKVTKPKSKKSKA
ncbi:J domain-containing protein [Penicillium malachiteum]|uniref:J domain-containing protein n=1 Tax=Penicillium malachiteum TaxID=1324776 RepID=UPI00254827F6|nr:J domain-containing protein [Penicillium malachiteum]KAJ5720511.1 J domain-containing protein [Penicillium malachiteum]